MTGQILVLCLHDVTSERDSIKYVGEISLIRVFHPKVAKVMSPFSSDKEFSENVD